MELIIGPARPYQPAKSLVVIAFSLKYMELR